MWVQINAVKMVILHYEENINKNIMTDFILLSMSFYEITVIC